MISLEYLQKRLLAVGLSPSGDKDTLLRRLTKTVSKKHWQIRASILFNCDNYDIINTYITKIKGKFLFLSNPTVLRLKVIMKRGTKCKKITYKRSSVLKNHFQKKYGELWECYVDNDIPYIYYITFNNNDNARLALASHLTYISTAKKQDHLFVNDKKIYQLVLSLDSYNINPFGEFIFSEVDITKDQKKQTLLYLVKTIPKVIEKCDEYGLPKIVPFLEKGTSKLELLKLPRDIIMYICTLIRKPRQLYLFSFSCKYISKICRDCKPINYNRFVKSYEIEENDIKKTYNLTPSKLRDGKESWVEHGSNFMLRDITWSCGKKHGEELVYTYTCTTCKVANNSLELISSKPIQVADIAQIFSKYGKVVSLDASTEDCFGPWYCAYIEYNTEEEANRAYSDLTDDSLITDSNLLGLGWKEIVSIVDDPIYQYVEQKLVWCYDKLILHEKYAKPDYIMAYRAKCSVADDFLRPLYYRETFINKGVYKKEIWKIDDNSHLIRDPKIKLWEFSHCTDVTTFQRIKEGVEISYMEGELATIIINSMRSKAPDYKDRRLLLCDNYIVAKEDDILAMQFRDLIIKKRDGKDRIIRKIIWDKGQKLKDVVILPAWEGSPYYKNDECIIVYSDYTLIIEWICGSMNIDNNSYYN